MKKTIVYTAIGMLALLLAACASAPKNAETRRAKVPDFAFGALQVPPSAYQPPDAKWTSDVQSQVVKYTGGGLVPALVGAVIDKHKLTEQQRSFDEAHASLLPAINERAKAAPSVAVEKAVLGAIRSNGFLAQKVRSTSNRRLDIVLVRFGLAKRTKEDSPDPLMVAQVMVDLTMREGQQVVLRLGGYSGSSGDALPITELAKSPDSIAMLYEQAANSLGSTVANFMSRKYDENP